MKAIFIIGFFLMMSSICWGADEYSEIGRFMSNIKQCNIEINGAILDCKANLGIKPNDIINYKGKLSRLEDKIDWLNKKNTRFDVVAEKDGVTAYRVIYVPPESKSILLTMLKSAVGYRSKHPTYLGATRGQGRLNSPEAGATLMADSVVAFSWCGQGKMLMIKKAGHVVYQHVLDGQTSTVEAKHINRGVGDYTWEIQGERPLTGYFRILSPTDAADIKKDLQSIEADPQWRNEKDRLLAKIIYLQQLSEYFGDQWRLNWLACQILAVGKEKLTVKDRKSISRIVQCDLVQCEE